eukprot:CAMPEP_0181251158 /NCGR_PEP_ID=MMETSP1096-20121128/46723_1 /TAXON_ID=156174 ORGANISM="Chrysochromulina ericina, Strain CCMP281" /NCGR_SAMPLE_ID=MMETSP1096 /ASSEMBLY_ACC=CAM_ASM_000453 /LENGTH=148 /DNA_ID=CAMNT_0023348713 /DNA_START=65 /DNA_END=511 /DNA_ORIENTATION=-
MPSPLKESSPQTYGMAWHPRRTSQLGGITSDTSFDEQEDSSYCRVRFRRSLTKEQQQMSSTVSARSNFIGCKKRAEAGGLVDGLKGARGGDTGADSRGEAPRDDIKRDEAGDWAASDGESWGGGGECDIDTGELDHTGRTGGHIELDG